MFQSFVISKFVASKGRRKKISNARTFITSELKLNKNVQFKCRKIAVTKCYSQIFPQCKFCIKDVSGGA